MNRLSFRFAERWRAITAASLGCLWLAGAGTIGYAADTPLPPETVQQITSLLVEKGSRTPAQNKLTSELLYAIRMARGEAVAPGVPTQRLSFAADANGRVTKDEYDGLGRRIATVLPLGQRSANVYDAAGNLAAATDFNGDTINYEYDLNNRLTAKHLRAAPRSPRPM